VVRALRPLGASVAVILDGGRRFPMTHLDRGVFVVTLPEEKVPDYRLATVYPGKQGDEAWPMTRTGCSSPAWPTAPGARRLAAARKLGGGWGAVARSAASCSASSQDPAVTTSL
jgi:hypothetical protein